MCKAFWAFDVIRRFSRILFIFCNTFTWPKDTHEAVPKNQFTTPVSVLIGTLILYGFKGQVRKNGWRFQYHHSLTLQALPAISPPVTLSTPSAAPSGVPIYSSTNSTTFIATKRRKE
jgi:hypothetical protein